MRIVEFWQGAGNLYSMNRLLLFMSFFPASYVLVSQQSETMLGLYLGAYAALAANGKWAERNNAKSVDISQLASDTDSDTISTDTASSVVVEKRSVKSTGTKRRSF